MSFLSGVNKEIFENLSISVCNFEADRNARSKRNMSMHICP